VRIGKYLILLFVVAAVNAPVPIHPAVVIFELPEPLAFIAI